MEHDGIQTSRDWLDNVRTHALAWWIPQAAIISGLLVPVPVRGVVWIIALIWMGTACILNARRCGRTHCRYTGPFYLVMIVPVAVLASGAVSVKFYGWLLLAVFVLAGSKIIWWATERAWGKLS
jgi:Ca2+/Na+ antiporter